MARGIGKTDPVFASNGNVTVTADPDEGILECDPVSEPNIPYNCRFAYLQGTSISTTLTYSDGNTHTFNLPGKKTSSNFKALNTFL